MLDQPEYLFATITTVKELFLVLLGAGGGMPIVFDLEAILFVLVMERVVLSSYVFRKYHPMKVLSFEVPTRLGGYYLLLNV